jgi:anti-sigma regulatory factor (Ser/Thr protein kinase)/ABC-type transporter Mla MlaB component
MPFKTDNPYTITIPSDISDVAMEQLMDDLERLLTEKPGLVSLDCSLLENIISSQIGFLWEVRRKCLESGSEIQLISPSSGLICVLKVLDLYDYFQYAGESVPETCEPTGRLVPTRNYADEFSPDTESIDRAVNRFVNFLKSLELHPMTIFELQTMFYEVATNIRNHSSMPESELIVVTARTDDKKIVLAFTDSGRLFDITKHQTDLNAEIAGKNKQRRGFGIVLIRRLADKIEYIGGKFGLNILVLEKKWI